MIIVMQAEAIPAQIPEVEGALQVNPREALKDGAQSITIPAFQTLMAELNVIGNAMGRRL